MIPTPLTLVPLLPERQAALQAIAAAERAQQKGARPGRHPLSEWESVPGVFFSTAGKVCPLRGELATTLIPQAVFPRASRSKCAADKTVSHAARRERQAADYRERQFDNLITQAETELAFRTPETLRGWFAAWCDCVPEYDLKNMIAAWARRVTSFH